MYLIVFNLLTYIAICILNKIIIVSCHVEENAVTLPVADGDGFYSSDNNSESNKQSFGMAI